MRSFERQKNKYKSAMKKFARWTVVKKSTEAGKVICRCRCGTVKTVQLKSLSHGLSKSCGCLRTEKTSKRRGRAHPNYQHGESKPRTREYRIWKGMRERCLSKTSKDYVRYGGRGINVCARWKRFENFLKDMGRCPIGMSLDRKNNEKNYSPKNCRWATPKQQANNRRKRAA